MKTVVNQPAFALALPFRRDRAFTLIELLVVISIIAVLAGLVVGIAPVASIKMRESRIRGELAGLVTAIESYKARFGVYPPDHAYETVYNGVQTLAVDPARNSLYYELTGVLVDNDVKKFITADDEQILDPDYLSGITGRKGIVNSLPRDAGSVRKFPLTREDRQIKRRLFSMGLKEHQVCEIFRDRKDPNYVDFEVLAVGHGGDASGKKGAGAALPLGNTNFPPVFPKNPALNPWRYVSTNPTNNPGSFDLWAEMIVNGEKRIIGNWKN